MENSKSLILSGDIVGFWQSAATPEPEFEPQKKNSFGTKQYFLLKI